MYLWEQEAEQHCLGLGGWKGVGRTVVAGFFPVDENLSNWTVGLAAQPIPLNCALDLGKAQSTSTEPRKGIPQKAAKMEQKAPTSPFLGLLT